MAIGGILWSTAFCVARPSCPWEPARGEVAFSGTGKSHWREGPKKPDHSVKRFNIRYNALLQQHWVISILKNTWKLSKAIPKTNGSFGHYLMLMFCILLFITNNESTDVHVKLILSGPSHNVPVRTSFYCLHHSSKYNVATLWNRNSGIKIGTSTEQGKRNNI